MTFNQHYKLVGQHAFLSASKHHWLNYDKEKLHKSFRNYHASERGTRLHVFAQEAILLGEKLPKTNRTLNMYVNDAIAYKMNTEVVLRYSDNCFGTADAIKFNERKKHLRIHDLKTGEIPASMRQLMVYAALFCLEYDYNPEDIEIELRLYQNNMCLIHMPTNEDEPPENIRYIMETIKEHDKDIEEFKLEIEGA